MNKYKYLGLTFSTRNSFSAALEESAVKAKKATMQILRTLKKIQCNSPSVFFKLFDSQVVPSLLYAAEIWGHKHYDQLERVHIFACKRFLRVPIKTTNDIVYGELGRYPLLINSTIKVIKYWLRILKQPATMYSKKAYNMLYRLHDKGSKTWVSHVKTILCENGFEQVWLFGCDREKRFIKELRERLFSSFCHRWTVHINDSSHLRIYASYKHIFERESYVTALWKDEFRCAIAQLRMGVSQLNVHRHRFDATQTNTLCPVCKEEQETECHFLFDCKAYSDIRSRMSDYLPLLNQNVTIQARLSKLLNDKSTNSLESLSKYIRQAFNKRARLTKE